MMAAMKLAFMLAVLVLALVMLADARHLTDYDDCRRGAEVLLLYYSWVTSRACAQALASCCG